MGVRLGIVTGLGAASVHLLYATLAITGASAVAAELTNWSHPVRWISCILLVILGVRVLKRRPSSNPTAPTIQMHAAFASSFALALCNPLTILPYLLFASSAVATADAEVAFTPLSPIGVFVGTATWYSIVSSGAALFRSGLPPGGVRVLNQVAGAMLIGFGLITIWR